MAECKELLCGILTFLKILFIYLSAWDFGCGLRAYLPPGMWDLSPQTRDQTCVPCVGRRILNPWTMSTVSELECHWP